MKIEVRELMDDNEMLSHIFLGCIPREQIAEIRNKYVGEVDWKTESVKIPVEMKIGGIAVNPKEFFDLWKNQMSELIANKAQKLLSEKLGSEKIRNIQNILDGYEGILQSWENDINWEVGNPFIDAK